jgi:transcriptional regulator with XRE-family HTH domain
MTQESTMIGEKIAARRQQLGWTQTDLAREIGIAPSRISEFENGMKTDCNLSTAKRLARALGCSIDYLADTWDEDEEPAAATPTPAARRGRPRGRPRVRLPRRAGAGLPPATAR